MLITFGAGGFFSMIKQINQSFQARLGSFFHTNFLQFKYILNTSTLYTKDVASRMKKSIFILCSC
ncbi:MAG: hypothetical protein A2Y23_01440 [Clostridiales bacterium GWB2_37_7]|nr:MAG: hypothetical protein A2Y23_01440 [Clostridiales bacterium GWB2_37_7]